MRFGDLLRRRSAWVGGALILLCVCLGFACWGKFRSSRDPDLLWREAEAALQSGSAELAAADLDLIHQLRTPTSLDRMLEAQVAIASEQPDKAIGALEHIPNDDPIASQAFLLAGRVERQRRRIHSAEIYFRRALRANPKLVDAHRELVYIFGIQSRQAEIDREYRALSQLIPIVYHDLYTWAFTQFSPHQPDDAKVLRAFVEAEAEDGHSRLALAEILAVEGDAHDEIDKLLERLPGSDPDVLSIRAKVALARGRPQEAESIVGRGHPDHAGLNQIRGKLATLRRDYQAAAEYFKRAANASPYDRVSRLKLVQVLTLAGDPQSAKLYLDQVKCLNEIFNHLGRSRSPDRENEVSDLLALAIAFEKAKLFLEASLWFELALNRDPLNLEAGMGLRRSRDLLRSTARSLEPRETSFSASMHP